MKVREWWKSCANKTIYTNKGEEHMNKLLCSNEWQYITVKLFFINNK